MRARLQPFDAWTVIAALQDHFLTVLVGVVVIGTLVAIATFLGLGGAYDQIGRGGLSLNEEPEDGPRSLPATSATAMAANTAERDAEIVQMLEARNDRRRRRGQEPLDIEEELRKLTSPATVIDAGLRAEIRQLVMARNARRERRGQEPLDVDDEVERQIRELS